MRRVAYLPKLQRQAIRRLTFLGLLIDPGLRLAGPEQDRRVAFVTIEAANVWSSFCRAFYLSCALGTHDHGGNKVVGAPRFRDEGQALAYAIGLVKGPKRGKVARPAPRDEPEWHQVAVFGKVMRNLNPPNLPQVQGALSIGTSAFTYLQTFRNFYAHRNRHAAEKTARAAPRLRVSSALHPTVILSSVQPGASDTILRDWLTDLTLVIDLMA